jgi:hypothetical protein
LRWTTSSKRSATCRLPCRRRSDIQERWAWKEPFVTFAHFVRQGGPTTRMGERQREAWMRALESAPDSGRVLIISHGRVIESGLVTCIPDGDFPAWGASFQHGEGVRMAFAEGRFQGVQLLRVSPQGAAALSRGAPQGSTGAADDRRKFIRGSG